MFDALKFGIQTSPIRRTRRPDVHARFDRRWFIQIADPHDAELRPGIGAREQVCAAGAAELPDDFVAAGGNFGVFGRDPGNREAFGVDQHVDGAVRGQMLAIAAPANSDHQGIGGHGERDSTTQTSAGSFH